MSIKQKVKVIGSSNQISQSANTSSGSGGSGWMAFWATILAALIVGAASLGAAYLESRAVSHESSD
ncbi:hypothetical protein [Microbulbifer sp. YPW16]|uniref:hypothetical protein n=1 Tax=Microbulbifer sp. YPW16 TaxID=2904242 RepID=UPI001E47E5BE|nr:hypothetical protein [Microbulbifer sp. YPW16]UHQ54771.1 hypothetical protein LVE68_14870 [Microbulbifer sp. YPW16]